MLKKKYYLLNRYSILGIGMFIPLLLGMLFPDQSGVSSIYPMLLAYAIYVFKATFKWEKTILVVIFGFVMITTVLYAFHDKSEYSTYKYLMLVFKVPSIILVTFMVRKNYRSYLQGIFIVLILFIIITVFHLYQSSFIYDYNNRLFVGLINPIWISRYAIFTLLMYFMFFRNRRYIDLIVISSVSLIVFYSGSKGPVVALIVTLIYLARGNKLLIFQLLLGTFIYLVVTNINLSQYDQEFLYRRYLTINPSNNLYIYGDRYDILLTTIKAYFNSSLPTILFGTGVGNSSSLYFGYLYQSRWYPHNIIVEIICEFGLLVFTLVAISAFKTFRLADRNLIALLLFTFINSLFSGDLLLNIEIFIFSTISYYHRDSTFLYGVRYNLLGSKKPSKEVDPKNWTVA